MTLGKNENEGNVVSFDFQMSGHGLACLDVECLFSRSVEFANYYEVEEIIRGIYFWICISTVDDLQRFFLVN